MTAVLEDVVAPERPRPFHVAVPALISCATIVILTLVITWGWGQPERFGSDAVYRAVMNFAVLARLGPVYLAALVVWPVMRLRGASMPWAAVGALSSAITFGIIGAIGSLTYFPPAQAAYYVLNPMVVAAVGSQIGCSAIGEVYVRWRRGGLAALGTWRLWAVAVPIGVAGFTLMYVGVIWDGGSHWFYLWIRGFMALFGTGQ